MASSRGLSKWAQIQRDFSGGEVGIRLAMRDDSEFHHKSVLEMENYIPSLQGTAVRTPGTRYIDEMDGPVARIIPYLTPTNDHAIIEITEGVLRVITGVADAAEGHVSTIEDGFTRNAVTPAVFQIANNPRFSAGLEEWDIDPNRYASFIDGNDLGCWLEGVNSSPNILMSSRVWKSTSSVLERPDAHAYGTAVIPDTGDGAWLKLRINLQYEHNYSGPDAEYQMLLKVGTAVGANDIWEEQVTGTPGAIREFIETITEMRNGDPLALSPGQVIHMSVNSLAIGSKSDPSTPVFRLFGFEVFAKGTIEITDAVIGVVPYQDEDLEAIQFVQSPYSTAFDAGSDNTGKEMVFTHPKYPPYELVVIAGVYTVREKVFNAVPDVWADNNYPAACTSFNGRLLLGGSQANPIPGDPVGSATETVWGTEVGLWNELITPDDPEDPGINADDSVEFTAIYRSPIQWLFGQRNLLIGAREMEYIASADGIFSPGDMGVRMQSTHGSAPVQPAGMGPHVLYAAEGGTKVRAMQFVAEDDGWTSPDMTLLHPELFSAGIVRMVRMRNPHQMVIVVMKSGQVAILHEDTYAGIRGWSRLNFNANVKDACVITGTNGSDILILTVQRVIQGVTKLYMEAIADWLDGAIWNYVQSSTITIPTEQTNVITGLEYLEGKFVQVVADGNYLGTFVVDNGQVTLIDQTGAPIYYAGAVVGMQMPCRLVTLPLVGTDPGAKKRYSSITVRCLFSDRPIINGERPPDRTPSTVQNLSQGLDPYYDNAVANMGWDKLQIITITETVPIRSEVVGIFGQMKANDVKR